MRLQSTPTEVLPGYEDVAALYARVSTDPQEAKRTSHGEQLRVMRDRLAEYGLREGMAIEETYSAGTRHRPELDRLLREVYAGKIGVVMVAYADRFVRDQIDLGVLLDAFRDHGVGLIAAREHVDSRTSFGVQQWNHFASYAEMEHKTIFRRLMDARLANAGNGSQPSSPRLVYGYRRDRIAEALAKQAKERDWVRWVVDESEAEWVRQIFQWVAEGATYGEVVRRLAERGVPTASGNAGWRSATISKLIHNTSYTGVTYAFRNTPKPKSVRKFPDTEWADYHRDGREPIRIEGLYPRIVSDELFARAGARATENKQRARRNTKRDYFLRSLMRCAVCGQAYIGQTVTKGDKEWGYYRCASHAQEHTGPCGARPVPMRETDERVWETFRATVSDEQFLRREYEAHCAQQEGSAERHAIAAMRQLLEQKEQKADRLRAFIRDADMDPRDRKDILADIAQLRTERDALEARIAEDEAKLPTVMSPQGFATMEQVFAGARSVIDTLTREERRQYLEVFVEKVTVDAEKHLHIHLKSGGAIAVSDLAIVDMTCISGM